MIHLEVCIVAKRTLGIRESRTGCGHIVYPVEGETFNRQFHWEDVDCPACRASPSWEPVPLLSNKQVREMLLVKLDDALSRGQNPFYDDEQRAIGTTKAYARKIMDVHLLTLRDGRLRQLKREAWFGAEVTFSSWSCSVARGLVNFMKFFHPPMKLVTFTIDGLVTRNVQ